jgi:hypothetical protein
VLTCPASCREVTPTHGAPNQQAADPATPFMSASAVPVSTQIHTEEGMNNIALYLEWI